MRPPPPGRRTGALTRRAGAVLATLLLGLGGAGVPPTGAQPPDEPEITFTGIETVPWVTRDGTWTLTLAIEGAPADGTVTAVIRDRLADRPAYDRALFGVVDGARKAAIPPVELATAPPAEGGGHTVQLAVTLLSENADQPGWKFLEDGLRTGVHPIEVEVLDADGDSVARTVVLLTRVPSDGEPGADAPPLLVAPVLPLGGRPSIEPDGTSAMPAGVVDRALALADGLSFTDDLPATLAPRPETVEALAREDGGSAALAELRRAVDDRQVLDSPYVDVPISAWIDAGLDDELRRQRERGNAVLTTRLGRADSSTLLATEPLSPAAVAELWDVGVRTVVLPPGTVAPPQATTQPFTVDAGDGRTVVGVEADPGLAAALVRRGDPVLDQAALAAELYLLATARDGPAGVAFLAPEGWPARPEDVTGMAEVLTDPAAPVATTTVADLVADLPLGPRRALRPPLPPDMGDMPERLALARNRLGSFQSMTGPGSAEVAALDQRLLLSGSATIDPQLRVTYVDSVLATVDRRLAAVEAPPRQTITLTSSDGVIPLTLRNQLDQPVQVRVELDADTRIEFPEGTSQVHELTPGTTRIPVPVHARVPGTTTVDVTVRTPDGVEVLDEVRYTVRSTAISGIGLVLSVGAGAFLLVWWGRHWRRSHRARRQDAARAAADSLVAPEAGAPPP